jgi:PTS system cellobiose-specific IIA component
MAINIKELDDEQICLQIISNSGMARSKVIEAIRAYKQKNADYVDELMLEASEFLANAQDVHFQLLQREAMGTHANFSLLLTHAQDHLLSSITMKDLASEFLSLLSNKNT